jgi:hypothetical protein
MLSLGLLQSLFESIHQNTNELLSILLLAHVSWLSIEILEGKVEAFSLVITALGQFKLSHCVLPLMQDIIVKFIFFVGFDILRHIIISGKDVVSERWNHE